MQVTVVGTGNVGSALLFPLSYNENIDSVLVTGRQEKTAVAAIMDVASANPVGATRMSFHKDGDLANTDVLVITAGVMQKGKNADEVHQANLQINKDVFKSGTIKESCIVICIATPVDDLTVEIQRACGLPAKQVIGFGGDLDTNRLRSVLKSRGMYYEDAHAVGEHGPKAIPIYAGEEDFEEVTADLRSFWFKIAGSVEIVRNLATADLLGKLVDSVVTDSLKAHNVCAYHKDHGVYLTWPFSVGRYGAEDPRDISVRKQAEPLLKELVEQRRLKYSTQPAL